MNEYPIPQQEYAAIKKKAHDLTVERDLHMTRFREYKSEIDTLDSRLVFSEQARAFLKEVAAEVQKNLEDRFSNIVTPAIYAVFADEDPPDFITRFVERRNTIECDMLFSKRDNEYPPKGGGFGAVDVADFAGRIAFWSLDKNRGTFILDEPFRNVSHDLQPKVSKMVKMLCQEIGLQIIMVSHQPGINAGADKIFRIEHGKLIQDQVD